MAGNLQFIPTNPESASMHIVGAPTNPESASMHIVGAPTTPGNNNDLKYVYQIRDQFYYLETWMYNQFDDYKPFQVSFFSIEDVRLSLHVFPS
jgi:hypothetical protein